MKPEELKYTKTHEWVAVDGDIATIGITDFAVHLLSDLVYAELPIVGKSLIQGQPFGEVESVKAVSDLYAPMSGVVTDPVPVLQSGADWATSRRGSHDRTSEFDLGRLAKHGEIQCRYFRLWKSRRAAL